MADLRLLKMVIGFSMKIIGLFWSIFDKFLCGTLCNNSCSVSNEQSCSLIFLFVGIIFIVCGYVVIIMKDDKKRTLKTKIRKAVSF